MTYDLWPWATAQYDTSTQEPLTAEGPWELPALQEGLHPLLPVCGIPMMV